jgi:hypothetical protein
MSPKEKAEELVAKIVYEFGCMIEYGDIRVAGIDGALVIVKEIQQFGNQMNIREPMMYWNSVESELNKMRNE